MTQAGPDHADESAKQRAAVADERDRVAAERDARADARDVARFAREHEVTVLRADAAMRDARADARDSDADHRDMAATLDAFVQDEADDPKALSARALARKDRRHSKTDRLASGIDRARLSDSSPTAPAGEGNDDDDQDGDGPTDA